MEASSAPTDAPKPGDIYTYRGHTSFKYVGYDEVRRMHVVEGSEHTYRITESSFQKLVREPRKSEQ